ARLPDELALLLDRLANGLAVGDLRLADVRLDLELALHAVDDDLEVQLAHARDDGLPRLLVGAHAERRIFPRELRKRDAHLLLVGLRLRLYGDGDDRLRALHLLERDHGLRMGGRVAGRGVLETHGRRNVAGAHFLQLYPVIGVHLQDAADTLALVLDGVVDRVARGQHARVDANEREVADERVRRDLERERGERRIVIRRTRALGLILEDALDRRDVLRRRQIVDDRVEHGLHALVLERAAAEHGHDLVAQAPRAQAPLDFLLGERLALEVLLEELLAALGRGLDQLLAVLLRLGLELVRHVHFLEADALRLLVPDDLLHLDQIDDAPEMLLGADRDLK